MSDVTIDMFEEQDQQDYELMKFECWYHSVIDDMASLIVSNGYDNIMHDVNLAVERMKNKV